MKRLPDYLMSFRYFHYYLLFRNHWNSVVPLNLFSEPYSIVVFLFQTKAKIKNDTIQNLLNIYNKNYGQKKLTVLAVLEGDGLSGNCLSQYSHCFLIPGDGFGVKNAPNGVSGVFIFIQGAGIVYSFLSWGALVFNIKLVSRKFCMILLIGVTWLNGFSAKYNSLNYLTSRLIHWQRVI